MTWATGRRANGWLIAGAAGLAGVAGGVVATRAIAGEVADRAGIETVVHDYILAHPEIIPEAMTRLQAKESARVIAAIRTDLERPFASAWAGKPGAKVTLVMFSDYACPYCKASAGEVGRLLAEHPDLKVVWREIPVLGPQSEAAARAALAAAKAGRYPAYHTALFAAGRPDAAARATAARAVGLDGAALERVGKGDDVGAELAANMALAGKLGITGTPAFVIGDQFLSGAVGYEALSKAIETARKS